MEWWPLGLVQFGTDPEEFFQFFLDHHFRLFRTDGVDVKEPWIQMAGQIPGYREYIQALKEGSPSEALLEACPPADLYWEREAR
jgi:hypothetical protein